MAEYGVFNPGDPVSVWSAYGSTVERLATVAKVGARKMVLSDKSEWRADGRRPYGVSAGYGNRSVRHRLEGDLLNHLRNQAQYALRVIMCERLAEADLRTILEIAKRSEKPKDALEAKNA